MIIVGLTGSIGMGKSTVAAMFAAEGIPVFDADAEVHRLQGPGGALVPAIEKAFPGTTGPDGVVRDALRKAVFGKPEDFARLEAIVHPAVGHARSSFLDTNRDQPIVLLDVPLLFETGGHSRVDRIVVVSAPHDIQRARVLGRPGMTDDRFQEILSRQTPDAEKRERADFVIHTGGTLDETRAAVRAVIACLQPPAGG